jgi:iron complex outermembrane receptor protein
MRMVSRVASVCALLACATAHAAIEEIVVEVQRRSQNLQDVPIAVTAMTGATLEKLQIVEMSDIGQAVPNLQTYEVTANGAAMQVHARGASVQNPGFVTSESPVGIYEDDVYRGRLATANLDLTDVERIEVLRGPQSTLYGRNTIAGAIKIFTRKPGDDFYANAALGYGNYETSKLTGAVGGAFIPGTFAGSLAGSYHNRDEGTLNNPNPNNKAKVGEYKNQALRGKLRWFDEEKFDLTLSAWWVDVANDGYNGIPYSPMFGTGAVPGAPLTGFYDNWTPATVPFDPRAEKRVNYGDTEQGGVTVDFSFDFDAFSLRSITAYTDIDDSFGFDLAGGGNTQNGFLPPGTPGLLIKSESNMKQVSQEIHLLGDAFDDHVNWIGGIYLMNEDGQQGYSGLDFVALNFDENSDVDTKSYAIFGEADWRFADRWSTTLGLRYTDERKTFDWTCATIPGAPMLPGDCAPPATTVALNLTNDYDKWTPRASVNFEVAENTLLYLSASTGFQAGGFQTLCFGNINCVNNSYGPQDVVSYELGYKGVLLDSQMILNAATFYAQYGDIQQTVISGGAFPTANVGDVDVWGLEVEWNYAPFEGLNLFANVGYMQDSYQKLNPLAPAALFGAQNLPSRPDWTGLFGFDYSISAGSALDVFFGSDLYYSDSYFSEATNSLPIDSYSRMNGFLGVGHPDRLWQVVGEVKNLTDSEDNVSGIFAQDGAAPPTFGITNIRTALPPRTYMVSVKFNY